MSDDIVWSYRDNAWSEDSDLVGYDVMSTDGSIGKIDETSTEISGSWLVVDTGFWIFGKKRLIPAGAVAGIDHEHEQVIVNMSKAAIKAAPDYESEEWDDALRGRHDEHYRAHLEGAGDDREAAGGGLRDDSRATDDRVGDDHATDDPGDDDHVGDSRPRPDQTPGSRWGAPE